MSIEPDLLDVAHGALAAAQPPVERRHGAGETRIVILEPGPEHRGIEHGKAGHPQAPAGAVGADAGGLQHPMLGRQKGAGERQVGRRRPHEWI